MATLIAVAALALISPHDRSGQSLSIGNDSSIFASGFVIPALPSAFRRRIDGGPSSPSHLAKASQRRWESPVVRDTTLLSASVVEESAEAMSGSSSEDATAAAGFVATNVDTSGHVPATPLAVNGDVAPSLDAGAVVNGASTANARKNGVKKEIAVTEATRKRSDTPKPDADVSDDTPDVPLPTEAGGYSHTKASKAKISAANKGKTPWNKGKGRSEEVKRRIAEGVRRRNRERFLAKLADMGLTEEEYEAQKKEERRKKDAERRARRTENGGYRPTEETKAKISAVLKEKWANGEVKKRKPSGGARRKGFKHSEETKQKIRESLRKRWATDPEYRAKKVSSAKRQNSSEDARKRIAETLRKKWEDPEFRAYMMDRMATRKKANVVVDDEHRKKISMAMKRKWQDASYRAKAVEGMRKHMEENPRPKRPAGSRRKIGGTKKAASDRVQVGDSGLFSVSSVAPQRKTVPRKKKTTRKVGDGSAAGVMTKRKKRKKKAAKASGSSAPLEAVTPLTKAKLRSGKDDEEEETIDMSDGSLDRLRLERRDLYDLLYGDEGEAHFATESAFYDKAEKKSDPKVETVGAPVSAPSVTPASPFPWEEDDLDDENLDNFDPYGLDDF